MQHMCIHVHVHVLLHVHVTYTCVCVCQRSNTNLIEGSPSHACMCTLSWQLVYESIYMYMCKYERVQRWLQVLSVSRCAPHACVFTMYMYSVCQHCTCVLQNILFCASLNNNPWSDIHVHHNVHVRVCVYIDLLVCVLLVSVDMSTSSPSANSPLQ